jgi:hydrogenase maturation protein HypF
MTDVSSPAAKAMASLSVALRVRGMVQGVGFRPTVWRIATEMQLSGDVRNDAEGVLIRLAGPRDRIDAFIGRLRSEAPVLARLDSIEATVLVEPVPQLGFRIAPSVAGVMATAIAPDAATCAECLAEVQRPSERRFRYPFTNCTHCGPRLTIIDGAPYDRANTTMRAFAMCPACTAEYSDPADRRFHAQPIACPRCGPALSLTRMDGGPLDTGLDPDPMRATAVLIADGAIVAIKGLGGFHLACDSANPAAVADLRRRKRRFGKAFAVMMRDLPMARRYCHVSSAEERVLGSPEAPIVLLQAHGRERLPEAVAPGLATIGVMLPYTPLHHLLMRELTEPAVMTSGNLSDEPQCIDGQEAQARLAPIADYLLDHDRRIVNRVDDSVVRVMAGVPALLRRARGFAPAPLCLPDGFAAAPPVLAMGGELKATICLVKNGQAIMSQHLGDLENALTYDDYSRTLELYLRLFDHSPRLCAVDAHPEYLSRKFGEDLAERHGFALVEVQHHHAHIAACLAENGVPLGTESVLGIALDGLGIGDDGTIWGGEFLLADYRGYRRLASLSPVGMPGGAQAVREPWRNTLAHLLNLMSWSEFETRFAGTPLHAALAVKPVAALASMIRSGVNAPLASSCGRLFDAVAGAIGLAADRVSYEGEAAARLEALVDESVLAVLPDGEAYPFAIHGSDGVKRLDPAPMWRALLADLEAGASAALVSARFHKGLSIAVADLALDCLRAQGAGKLRTVALSGGCFQNKPLLEQVKVRLEAAGVAVLIHAKVPANDGGLSLGQAAIAAARGIAP